MGRGLVYPAAPTAMPRRKRTAARASRRAQVEETAAPQDPAEPDEAPGAGGGGAGGDGGMPGGGGPGGGGGGEPPADGYREKLVKYVPAEVIAFFVPITAALGTDKRGLVIAIFIAGALGALAFLYRANLEVPEKHRAPAGSYALALIAYGAWALGTSAATASALAPIVQQAA